jgi:hypothetical protein
MNEKVRLGGILCSLLLSVTELVMALLMVPHIFGIMISVTLLIINILYLIYELKVKQVLSNDIKKQYEELGKKHKETMMGRAMRYVLGIGYISTNVLMLIMVIIRASSLLHYSREMDVTSFPYSCGSRNEDGCARFVLNDNSCKHVESMTDKDYTLIMDSHVKNSHISGYNIVYYINYCAQSINIGALKYPREWPPGNTIVGFTHQIVETTFLGIVDDVYIQWHPFGSSYTLVEMQSIPRFGNSLGLERNQDNIEEFYTCLKTLTQPTVFSPSPCSANA